MSCETIRPQLHGYLDNELDVPHILDLEQHLQHCIACSHELEELQLLSNSLRALAATEETNTARLARQVCARLRSTSRVPGRNWNRWLSLAAAAAVIAVTGSFIGRMLGTIASMARLLDAETVVVGMQPAVAITMVELGMSLAGVRTALNVDAGMEVLRSLTNGTGGLHKGDYGSHLV